MNKLSCLVEHFTGSKVVRPRPRSVRPTARLAVESLESRCLLSSVTELPPLPSLSAAPTAIVKAADGSLWFTEKNANKLGRLSTSGVLTEYAVPTASGAPEQITASPDGNVWFTERYGRKIGRIGQSGGTIAEFALTGVGEFPTAITTRQDGTVWFASNQQPGTARLGRISSAGTINYLPTGASSTYITSMVGGPDGNLWVTEVSAYWGDAVAKVNTTGWGTFTNYRLPNRNSRPQSITVGPDNRLWFTEYNTSKIGQITTSGMMTEIALAPGLGPQQIVRGPDGSLWFTEQTGNQIGRITTTGVVTEYAVPSASSQPFGITVGADNNLYFTELSGNKLGMVVV